MLLSPFHGGNTGSNPVGDANNPKNLMHPSAPDTIAPPCLVSFDQSLRLKVLTLKMEDSCPREKSLGMESHITGIHE